MKVTYQSLLEKFKDKGEETAFHYYVSSPIPYDPSRFIEPTIEKYNELVQKVYGKDWDYWNTWIDYQKHK
jgi:predicted phage-related endonuclease